MAITFTGVAKTGIILGNDAVLQNLFSIENGISSRVNINIHTLKVGVDIVGVLTAVTPILRISRATSISGGQLVEKVGFDTSQTSDPAVNFRVPDMESARITATPGTTIWEQFINRMHTAVEQQQPVNPVEILPAICGNTGNTVILHPGENLLVQLVAAAGTSNPAVNNNYYVKVLFDEDSLSTFAISGTVTLNGVGLTGAKVMVIEADDINLTNAFLRDVITTPAGGAWSSTIRTGKVGAAFVQYNTGGTYYTAAGSPFLS